MVQHEGPLGIAVVVILVDFFHHFLDRDLRQVRRVARRAPASNARFLRAFRKATGLEAVMVASEQFRPSPLVSVFDFGYEEMERQVKSRGAVINQASPSSVALQLGVSEELAKLERNMSWLATTASVTPFIGLLGTVLGIIRAFQALARRARPACARSGPGFLKRWWRPRSACSRPFRRPFSTTSSATRSARSARAWTISRSSSLTWPSAVSENRLHGFLDEWRRYRVRGGAAASPAMAEINVTPFVDVVLVLLIIFMLTAHVMESGMQMDVPQLPTSKNPPAGTSPSCTSRKTGHLPQRQAHQHQPHRPLHQGALGTAQRRLPPRR